MCFHSQQGRGCVVNGTTKEGGRVSIIHLVQRIPIGLVLEFNNVNRQHMIMDLKFPREYSVNDGITFELLVVYCARGDDEVYCIL